MSEDGPGWRCDNSVGRKWIRTALTHGAGGEPACAHQFLAHSTDAIRTSPPARSRQLPCGTGCEREPSTPRHVHPSTAQRRTLPALFDRPTLLPPTGPVPRRPLAAGRAVFLRPRHASSVTPTTAQKISARCASSGCQPAHRVWHSGREGKA